MNKIKAWKITDLTLQASGIVLPWIFFGAFPTHPRIWHLENLIVAYISVSAVQLISCAANFKWLPAANRAKSRSWYESMLLVLLAMGIIAAIMHSNLLMLMILFYVIPIATIWYLGISAGELLNLKHTHDA